MSKEFYETRKIFRDYIHYEYPLSFDQWTELPQDHKAAWLYVQYFNEIISAWYKSKSFYASEQEGVETICQYLLINVPIIEKNPKRFTPNYIYRIAYNCLYCISHDRVSDKLKYELEMSHIISNDGEELDILDLLEDEKSRYDDSLSDRERLWKCLIALGEDALEFASYLIDGGKLPKGAYGRKKDLLRRELEAVLEPFKNQFYN